MKRTPVEKSIVFINQSSGYLMVDIINQFVESGYNCDLITGLLVEREYPLNKNVKVRKIIRYNNTTSFRRIFTWAWGTIHTFFIVLFRYQKAHLFIVSNPPTASLIPLVLSNSFSLLIFDVYPDAITELGVLTKQSLLIRIWKKANNQVFSCANDIFTITDGMKDLLQSYIPEKQINVIPLWANNEFLNRISPEQNPFVKSHNLEDSFVVLYSGNIGISNNVEVLLEVAKLINNNHVIFVIIGNGARKKQLEMQVKKEGQDNVIILPWQDASNLPFTLSAANLAVVTLGEKASRLAIPSKIFSLLPLGTPILGIAGMDSDLCHFIETHNIGQCFLPEDKTSIVQYIMDLVNNEEYFNTLRNNALIASQLFTRENAEKFIKVIN